ncbi:MAG: ribosomal RNA small subunit methyltransferase A [Deltaproteobacteria bacterium]|nr:ribosomal RNA small subunit methyltransferase A [Deltaproteobacteria bacterium]
MRSRALFAKAGLRPRKSLGQHFLEDPNVVRKIISHARLQDTDVVVEIGPGLGALTIPMLPHIRHLVAIEKDPLLIDLLREKLSPLETQKITLVSGDVLQFDFKEIYENFQGKVRLMGNLPYNISSPFMEHLIANRHYVRNAILTFQYEVAQRLIALPNSKDYGALSIASQYYARISPLFKIKKECFYPKPKVNSMLLEFNFEMPHPVRAKNEEHFLRIVKAAFSCRRKTILNSLQRGMVPVTRHLIAGALEKSSIEPSRRAETLTIDEYIRLSSLLSPDTTSP